ncbi:MAG: hypothetical protein OER04_02455 [Cyclobacteriaceae bacterium]|nr:hypothetical protein [Cyclobacteriaceae bacterium]
MNFLTISILLNVALFVAFKTFNKWRIPVFQAVVFNYIVCALMGALFLSPDNLEILSPLGASWQYFAIILGFIFIGTFYILGLTTNAFGITIATISSKMSLIIPVVFALFIFKTSIHLFNIWNYLGITLALAAVILTSIKKPSNYSSWSQRGIKQALPLALFLLAGTLDTIINYVNYRYLTIESQVTFIWIIFITAAAIGVIILLVRWEPIRARSIWGGLYLGVPNFFSMYFIVKALTAFNNDGAVLFPLFNVGIIIGSTLAAVIIFRERLLSINKIGIILAVISVIMISYQELIIWLN